MNDPDCGWIHLLAERPDFASLQGEHQLDWLIVGGGYSGLSAAHRLAEQQPEAGIMLLDAEAIGEGASARNSGYIVDSTLNDGQADRAAEDIYRLKYGLNLSGIARLKQQIQRFGIDCDWDESGKYHSAVSPRHFAKLQGFSDFLTQLEIGHELVDAAALKSRLGTSHYKMSVHTQGGVLINPAALSLGLARALANLQGDTNGVSMHSHSPVLSLAQQGGGWVATTPKGWVCAKNVIVTVNAFMPRLGLKSRSVFPLTLSGGLTRPLTTREYAALGQPAPWGVLSVHPMGATVRLTNDRRLLLRNTVESVQGMRLSDAQMQRNREGCLNSLKKRFPMLPDIELAHYWAGNVCISRNNKAVFERAAPGLYLAGCYNAGGIAMGSLFGQLIVDYALGDESEQLNQVLNMEKANRLPAKIFAVPGLHASLAWRRARGRVEA